jgi:hypothetical protein
MVTGRASRPQAGGGSGERDQAEALHFSPFVRRQASGQSCVDLILGSISFAYRRKSPLVNLFFMLTEPLKSLNVSTQTQQLRVATAQRSCTEIRPDWSYRSHSSLPS